MKSPPENMNIKLNFVECVIKLRVALQGGIIF